MTKKCIKCGKNVIQDNDPILSCGECLRKKDIAKVRIMDKADKLKQMMQKRQKIALTNAKRTYKTGEI